MVKVIHSSISFPHIPSVGVNSKLKTQNLQLKIPIFRTQNFSLKTPNLQLKIPKPEFPTFHSRL